MRFVSMVALVAFGAWASEGKWMPQQALELGPAWVKQQGFGLPLRALWDEKKGGGLLANAVQLPGCSGSFVSKTGLLITNHHCVVSMLQQHSTPERNLVRDGYLAKDADGELPGKAFRVQVPRAFRDVTKEVLAAVPPDVDDLGRYRAVEAKEKQLVRDCERTPGSRCTFATFDDGRLFTLTEFAELSDVRLVYAPAQLVGDFGGEVDNWMWPRHSGDFALVRVYQDGKPYAPAWWFPVSPDGVKPGDAVAVLGYPGRSYRAQLATEMAERQERWYPRVRELLGQLIAVMQREGDASPAVAIAVADDLRSLHNVKKNAEGQLAGLARGHLVAKQREAEARVKAFAARKPALEAALKAYDGLLALHEQQLATWDHDFLLDMAPRAAHALSWPLLLVRRSVEAQKTDAEREPGYQERDLARLRERMERDQKRHAQAVDDRLAAVWVRRALELSKEQRLAPIDTVFASARDEAAVLARVRQLTRDSKVFDLPTRLAMFDETPEQLKARRDPLIDLALALDAERRALRDRRDAQSGRELVLRPQWRAAVLAEAGRPVAPDANSTLRVTFGRVKGYSPRDAVQLGPQTTLAGLLEKHTGEEPFDAPAKVREAATRRRVSRWVDRRLGDVPVDFLSDCDTTSGNSGSPTIDGKGRLVGVNFDRVWENVANDFGYNPDVARNVNVDVRYLLWLLEDVEGAASLLAELGVPAVAKN